MDLTVFEYLAQQITDNSDDSAVFEYMKEFLDSDLTEEETKQVTTTLKETFDKIGKPTLTNFRHNLAIYSQNSEASVTKFYKWLDVRLNRLINEKITYVDFMDQWENVANGAIKKMKSTDTSIMDRVGIHNVIIFMNNLKESDNVKRD